MKKNEFKKIINPLNKRNYGIDILRFISMINIINLHINGFSNMLKILKYDEPQYKPIWRLQAASRWGVNGFGLISGIVGYKRYKFANLIFIWITVLFYSIIISLILYLKNAISKRDFFFSLFPILIKRHWYFNAYFQMYLLLPFINNGIKYLTKKELKNIIIFLIGFYSLYNILGVSIHSKNYHFLLNGYSGMWLTILYIIGSYIGKYIIINKSKNHIFYFIFFILLYIFSSLFSSEIHFKLLEKKSKIQSKLFINYLSPTMLLQAISLIMTFSRLEIRNERMIQLISFFTPLTFSVQLIHTRLFQNTSKFKFIKHFFHYIKKMKSNMLFFKIYGFSILIFFLCSLIDYFRYLLFKLIKVREFCLFIEKIFPEFIDKLSCIK